MINTEFFSCLKEFTLQQVTTVWIEEFKNYSLNGRLICLRQEPIRGRGTEQDRAFYAGLCEFYCNMYHLDIPEWLNKAEYMLSDIWKPYEFSAGLSSSPMEFKKRNIIIDEQDLILC